MDLDDSIQRFEQEVMEKPNQPLPHYNLGYCYKAENRSDDAIRMYERAIQLDPDNNISFLSHYGLAQIYCLQHEFDEALQQFEKAAEDLPSLKVRGVEERRRHESILYQSWGMTLYSKVWNAKFYGSERKDLVSAQQYLERALRLDPQDDESRSLLKIIKKGLETGIVIFDKEDSIVKDIPGTDE